jgi:hypothetical protein
MGLFEDTRSENLIYLDTRTIRIAETFLRTAKLYLRLGVPEDKKIICQIEHGGLEGRILSAANPLRAFTLFSKRACSENVIPCVYEDTVKNFLDSERLKEIVFDSVKAITEMCDMFVPSKPQVTDLLVDNFLKGRIE